MLDWIEAAKELVCDWSFWSSASIFSERAWARSWALWNEEDARALIELAESVAL